MISRLTKLLGKKDTAQRNAIEVAAGHSINLRKTGFRYKRKPSFDPSLFLTARDIWDSIDANWRLFQAPCGRWIQRPAHVAMVSRDTRGAPKRVEFTLHDGLSIRLNALRDSEEVAFLDCETGRQIGGLALDTYLNHSGFVIGALDVSLSMFDITDDSTSQPTQGLEELPQLPVNRMQAAEHLAIAKFALLQFGQALFMKGQTEETLAFLQIVSDHWRPCFAWHIDIWQQLAAGVDRFRFSDINYQTRGHEVIQIGINILEFHGISSSSILCDQN